MLQSSRAHSFPGGNLYSFQENDAFKAATYVLEPGLSVVLTSLFNPSCDYLGGHTAYAVGGDGFWVEVLAVEGNTVKGRVEADSLFFKAGSIIWFELKFVQRVRGTLTWNIKHLTVQVSESIFYNREKVGYFYNTLSEEPMSFGRVFYSISETLKCKAGIPLVTMPLSALVEIDPVLFNYLENHAMDGWVRENENTFRSLEDTVCNRRIFPAGYEDDIIIADPPAEDLGFDF